MHFYFISFGVKVKKNSPFGRVFLIYIYGVQDAKVGFVVIHAFALTSKYTQLVTSPVFQLLKS